MISLSKGRFKSHENHLRETLKSRNYHGKKLKNVDASEIRTFGIRVYEDYTYLWDEIEKLVKKGSTRSFKIKKATTDAELLELARKNDIPPTDIELLEVLRESLREKEKEKEREASPPPAPWSNNENGNPFDFSLPEALKDPPPLEAAKSQPIAPKPPLSLPSSPVNTKSLPPPPSPHPDEPGSGRQRNNAVHATSPWRGEEEEPPPKLSHSAANSDDSTCLAARDSLAPKVDDFLAGIGKGELFPSVAQPMEPLIFKINSSEEAQAEKKKKKKEEASNLIQGKPILNDNDEHFRGAFIAQMRPPSQVGLLDPSSAVGTFSAPIQFGKMVLEKQPLGLPFVEASLSAIDTDNDDEVIEGLLPPSKETEKEKETPGDVALDVLAPGEDEEEEEEEVEDGDGKEKTKRFDELAHHIFGEDDELSRMVKENHERVMEERRRVAIGQNKEKEEEEEEETAGKEWGKLLLESTSIAKKEKEMSSEELLRLKTKEWTDFVKDSSAIRPIEKREEGESKDLPAMSTSITKGYDEIAMTDVTDV